MRLTYFSRLNKQGIYVAIIFIAMLIIGNFSLYWYNRVLLIKSLETKEQVLEVHKQMESIWNLIQLSDLGIRGYLLVHNDHALEPYNEAMERYPTAFDELERILAQQQFDLKEMSLYKAEYFKKMDETKLIYELKKAGNTEEALKYIEKDSGYDLWLVYAQFQKKVKQYENTLVEQAQTEYQRSLHNTLILQLALLILSFPILGLVFYILKRNEKQKKNLFKNLNESQNKYLFQASDNSQADIEDKRSIGNLITNLENASFFIKNITHGNYEIEFPGLDHTNQNLNKDNLTGNLIEMREQMKKVREEDKRRLWANEGLTKFADLLRIDDEDFDAKLHQFLAELVKYIGANQGALFVLKEQENGEQTLDMAACYAYGKKKFIKKTVGPGEGIVGQVYLEKEPVIITDIPSNYIKITSGLGEALPRCLLAVPMKNNDEVVGVLEIASFRILEEHEIAFIIKILETLASTIIMANINSRTIELLKESQQQAEWMRAQEEEMRQNIEELSATQEEMNRKEKEYLKQLQGLSLVK